MPNLHEILEAIDISEMVLRRPTLEANLRRSQEEALRVNLNELYGLHRKIYYARAYWYDNYFLKYAYIVPYLKPGEIDAPKKR